MKRSFNATWGAPGIASFPPFGFGGGVALSVGGGVALSVGGGVALSVGGGFGCGGGFGFGVGTTSAARERRARMTPPGEPALVVPRMLAARSSGLPMRPADLASS